MEIFYIICPLNLEKTTALELREKFEHYNGRTPTYTITQGGIELECSDSEGYALNLYMKTATRILRRIKSQKCRDFPKLYKIIQKINWKQFCKREDIDWNITTKTSRLINTKKMEETCNDALNKYFNANNFSEKIKTEKDKFERTSIFIRVEDDNLQISYDTSGDPLYIRGGEAFRGHAPIRSSIAAALIFDFLKDKNDINLIDPMCGTGTFIKEAQSFYAVNTNRAYNFQQIFELKDLAPLDKSFDIKSIIGIDKDPLLIKKANFNVKLGDVFTHIEKNSSIVICNPPYGKRVKLDRERNTYYKDLIGALKTNFKAAEISIILPLDIKLKEFKRRTKIFNSGIWLYHYIL